MAKKIHRMVVVVAAAVAVLTMCGCLKEGDESILLPVRNSTIPYEVLPAEMQDSLRQWMDINEGGYPAKIEGIYTVKPMELVYASDGYEWEDFYDLNWRIQEQNDRNFATYTEWQRMANGTGREAHVIGDGKKFTVWTVEDVVNEADGWSAELVTIVSGKLIDQRVTEFGYGIVMRNKVDEDSVLISPDFYRVFTDKDGFCIRRED